MIADLAAPGDLDTPTGGYVYDRRTIAASGGALRHLPLPGGFPTPDAATLERALAILRAAPGPLVIDGLALGALPAEAVAALRGPVIALCHHPLGMEPGLDPAEAARLIAAESAALAACAGVVVTSRTTAATLTERLGVPAGRITVAEPGLDRAPRAPLAGDPPVILGVGTISRRKGWDVLVRALGALREAPWRCVIAGPRDREPEADAALTRLIAEAGLDGRVERPGAVDQARLDALYAGADIFCLPSRYEGYGMVLAEAMMRGLPVVSTRAGAIPEVVAPGAGMLAPPDDPEALADLLGLLLSSPPARRRLADAARARAESLPGWDAAARIIADAVRRAS